MTTIDERSRHELYLGLEQELGTERADTLMALLPPVGWAEVATKQDLVGLEERLGLRFDAVDLRFEGVDQRFDAIDQRFEGVDQRFDAIDQRFDGVGQRFDSLETKLLGALDSKIGEFTSKLFFWLLGILAVIISALILRLH